MSSIAPEGVQTRVSDRAKQFCLSAVQHLSESLSVAGLRESQQFVLWIPILFGAGITLWFFLGGQYLVFAALAAGGMLALLGWALGGQVGQRTFWAAVLFCAGIATIELRSEIVAAPRLEQPITTTVSGRIERIERFAGRGITRLTVIARTKDNQPMRIRLSAPSSRLEMMEPGMTISARARLMPPAPPPVPGGYDFARAAWFKGIGASGRILGEPMITATPKQGGFWIWMDTVRGRLTVHVQSRVQGKGEGGIAATLITGDQGGIPDDIAQALRDSGLAHLLSISGLHVSAVVGFAMLATRWILALSMVMATRLPLTIISAGFAALAGVAYSFLAGGQVPTIRSCLAALLVLIGLAMGRDAITLRIVAAGAFIILILWPETLVGASFQMSFAAVTTIVALHELPWMKRHFSRREEAVWHSWLRGATALFITGMAIEIVLAPIGLFHFNRMGVYGAFANILAIPWTTFVIMPIEALALFLDPLGMSAPFYWLLSKALTVLIAIAETVAHAPGGIALAPAMPKGAFVLMMAGVLWLALWRGAALRLYGLALALVGALWAVLAPVPDILITGDGRHMALRGTDGEVFLLRTRTGDYMRSIMGDALAGRTIDSVDMVKAARCSPDLCILRIETAGRPLEVMATRSSYFVDREYFEPACRRADIVMSDRRLPRWCSPKWLKADRVLLSQTGGLAIYAQSGRLVSVADEAAGHPWAYRNDYKQPAIQFK